MRNVENGTHIEGYVYDLDRLELKVSGENSKHPGTEFISGTVSIATDEACTNIVPVHFTYVTATTSKGNPNATFGVLKDIIDGHIGTYMRDGADKAGKVRIDSAIGLNDYYTERDGKEELVSYKRNEGGFIHVAPSLAVDENARNTFKADMVITSVNRVEGDPDRGTKDKVTIRGCIFDFRKSVLPVEFSVTNEKGMNYFEGLGATSKTPVFTKVWGRQISQTIINKTTEESSWGEDSVRETVSSRRDWVVVGSNPEPYEWDSDDTITAAELTEAMAQREIYLADIKKRRDEYKASQAAPAAKAAPAGFDF